ncbi:MAG TPA: DUF58 domain-containing protein [Bryobacteraceae bacterium]|nr:DUF58 domain-containing protein [Bryobacteraceae bacterium]
MVPSARLIWLVAAIGFPAAIMAALLPGERWIAIAAISLIAILAILDALLRARPLAGIRIVLPEFARFYKDREGRIPVRVLNRNRRAQRVRVGLVAPEGIDTPFEEQRIELPSNADASEFSWTFVPRRRGRYRFESGYLEAASPLGLWLVRRRDPVAFELRVYPNLRRDNDLKALRRGVEGWHSFRQIGRGRDFEKLREYIPGDGFDEIHWKATARRGRPVTKVFQVERTQEIYVVIDASRLSGRPAGGETVLEQSITAGLIAGAAAERRGDLFGLAAFSDRVESFTRARNGKAHYAACRDSIYELQPRPVSPDFDEIATFLRLRLRRRALLLFLTSLDDPVLAENFARASKLLARRHLAVVAMLRPASAQELFHEGHHGARVESVEDIYRRLAGHLSWRRLRELETQLAHQGVRLAMLEPGNLAAGLIGLYDEVKQRQLL